MVVRPRDLPRSCAGNDAERAAIAKQLGESFKSMHFRVDGAGKTMVAADALTLHDPGRPMTNVSRGDTYVEGWLDTGWELPAVGLAGKTWLQAVVRDPTTELSEDLVLEMIVRDGDKLICGDVIEGSAMRQDLPKKTKAKAPKAK